ncbi:hypothetical protein BDFG_06903 [Blastomyces dermatitidis ATCC 26199]|nr:hypothetical protein BDFG_06903 [Blastomyces dermatitidis ATCC 26199]
MESRKYIPPALRYKAESDDQERDSQQQQQQQQHPNPTSTTYRRREIDAYFGHSFHHSFRDKFFHNINSSSNNNYSRWLSEDGKFPPPRATTRPAQARERRRRGTLNTAANDLDTLAYIILFSDAHPFWETKREILCKSNLDLLRVPVAAASTMTNITTTTTTTTTYGNNNDNNTNNPPSPAHPTSYPIFIDQAVPGRRYQPSKPHSFVGYYRIRTVRYLEPRSRELAAYLEVRFGTVQRTPEKWIGCFSRRWAVITVDLDGDREEWEGAVVMACGYDGETEGEGGEKEEGSGKGALQRRSVNEILAEMRGGVHG